MNAMVYAVGLILAPLCAAGTLLARRGRWVVGLLMGVFTGGGLVLATSLQLRIGLGLIVTGVACCLILGAGFRRNEWSAATDAGSDIPQGLGFRVAVVALVAAAAWGLSERGLGSSIPLRSGTWISAVLVFAMGILQVGLSRDPGTAAVGLLVLMVGFETAYAHLEPSLAMRAVLASIMIGIALVINLSLEAAGSASEGERRSP